MSPAAAEPVEQRVLILAPTGNDARLTQRFLSDAGIHSEVVRGIAELCAGIDEGCGTLLIAEETLAADTVAPLLKTISEQPSWSDIPLVLITSGGETSQTRLRRMTTLGPVGNVTMLERPFRPVTLLSAIETALRARRKQYEVRDLLKEVQSSERQVQSVLASIADGFVAVDKEWRFTYLNAAYLKLIAPLYSSASLLLGENLWEKFPDLRGTSVEDNYRKAMANQKPVSFELLYEPISTWIEVRVYPAPDALSIYVRDITDRKQSELEVARARDEALEAARAKDDFLAALSHELRTPLNPILLIASEAANDPELPGEVREDFETIARNATLEARLIDDLLDLTRITHGKMSLDKRTIDLHTVLADALETVSPELREKKQTLNVRLASVDCPILGDPARVQQIFWNVLKNAVKFTPEGGAITVETHGEQNTSWCVVRITDSGIGMTNDELSRVFDAFSQGNHAHNGSSHRFGGLGLGLAISRMLIELHAGKISAASKGRDQGSVFTIEFPRASVDEDSGLHPPTHRTDKMRASAPPFSSGKNRRILVVEDHVATRLSLTRLLLRRGYTIVEAGTVAEALERAAEARFDLVVSDIGLPDGDGYSLMKQLREKHGLIGIALSGYGMEQDIARGRAAGFTEHLIKPVNIESLDRVLRTWAEALP
ncbi:hybrid sensor histidine kinase/response regulator [Nibricoccus aquaticus]|uniref:hybrid sensor histidine kinase/response regulator n=1 Tax=Nibricoccus aquaticus TaxID=2576891 RepID=UPI001586C2BD|nr:PAS domain-containing sensor histidine kinase [Nibricoccus aquaticus]